LGGDWGFTSSQNLKKYNFILKPIFGIDKNVILEGCKALRSFHTTKNMLYYQQE